MNTSIIIITYNGIKRIPRLLLSINELSDKNFEVLIVDDGSTDHPEKVVPLLNLNFKYKIIQQENQGRAGAKNKGASLAAYELLWFIDDDMKVEKNTLTAHLNHHLAHENSISVGSQLEDEPLMTTDIQKYKCFISRGWRAQIEAVANPLSVNDLYMTSANVSMPKSLFQKLGGFDIRLRDAEDLDLVYRAYLAKIQVYFNRSAVGYHLDPITCRSYIIRNRQYLEAYSQLRQLNPHYMSINSRMHISKPDGLKKRILALIAQPVYVSIIDKFNFFKFILPLKLRYRFYELVIFGLGRVFVTKKI